VQAGGLSSPDAWPGLPSPGARPVQGASKARVRPGRASPSQTGPCDHMHLPPITNLTRPRQQHQRPITGSQRLRPAFHVRQERIAYDISVLERIITPPRWKFRPGYCSRSLNRCMLYARVTLVQPSSARHQLVVRTRPIELYFRVRLQVSRARSSTVQLSAPSATACQEGGVIQRHGSDRKEGVVCPCVRHLTRS
jgi:hypothetical protein